MPVHRDSVDDDQYPRLVEFKRSCRNRGLVEEYEDVTEFREKLARQLAQTIIRRFGDTGSIASPEEPQMARREPSLSNAAKDLLLEVAKDTHGSVLRVGTLGGLVLHTNGRNLAEKGDTRSEAKLRSAVDELAALGLIEDRAGKGESFFMTGPGYEAADALGSGASSA